MTCVLAAVVAAALGPAGLPSSSPWTMAPSPNPSPTSNLLLGVAAFTPADAWSVGTWVPPGGGQRTLTQHWNGTTWQTVDSPNTDLADNTLEAVDGVAGDMWAVGYAAATADDPDQAGLLVLHGDGTTWSVVPVAAPGVASSLVAIDMLNPSDGWAVGAYRPDSSAAPEGLILRWTGTTWTQVDAPDLGVSYHLTGVSGSGSDDVWAVGYTDEAFGKQHPVLLHWDGQSWSRAASPPVLDSAVLYGVSSAGPDNVWAVGASRVAAGLIQPYALRWSGSAWLGVTVPQIAEDAQLQSVVAVPSGVWTVGYQEDIAGVESNLVLIFDTDQFQDDTLPLPPPNVTGTALRAIAATPAGGALWTVGWMAGCRLCPGHMTHVLRRSPS